ncbi:MAG: type III-B CRISPR module RAMP protein Cmr1 [Oscillospiraceae bacterium]|jgi:CRISPR-associated protein Cmr1|nr:type III-B CRISPR module RAMP protein Cmr1 [Oscillospiraceae bacterium]
MQKTTYTCEVLTPIFIAGANPSNPELRAVSIKGVMRYFYRAVQCGSDGAALYKKEKTLFGGADGDEDQQSGLRIQVVCNELKTGEENMLPHRQGPQQRLQQAIRPGTTFQVILRSFGAHQENHGTYEALFELTALLGGFGRRSRRGFGSVMITKVKRNEDAEVEYGLPDNPLQKVQELLEKLVPDVFEMNDASEKIRRKRSPREHYPYIEEIHITVARANALAFTTHYGHKSHEIQQIVPKGFRLTGSIAPRYASPVYCTIATKTQGFVSKLHGTQNVGNDLCEARQRLFINSVCE